MFGQLELHGSAHSVHWTELAESAPSGSNQLTLSTAVDWDVGDEIVVSTTSYNAWETETFSITGVSEDKLTLTLNDSLKYSHSG